MNDDEIRCAVECRQDETRSRAGASGRAHLEVRRAGESIARSCLNAVRSRGRPMVSC